VRMDARVASPNYLDGDDCTQSTIDEVAKKSNSPRADA